jgi:uncharacterized membrane protein
MAHPHPRGTRRRPVRPGRYSAASRVTGGPPRPGGIVELLSTFDVGPTRTLQRDVEFGVIQIVDIALQAISPAVNDPRSANQLNRILIRWLGRAQPASVLFDPSHVPRVVVLWISVGRMLHTALADSPLRDDGCRGQPATRAIGDIAATLPQGEATNILLERARRVVDGCSNRLSETDVSRLHQRLSIIGRRLEV